MFSPDQGAYYALDAIGTRIWQLLEQPRSIGEICATLCSEYEVDPETCRRDVSELVDRLREAQLIREVT